ncbi:hypothetical protein [Actinoplanes sp. G11-F43]|uniref:hypothetical protein n=1 Tax=Actinoplanes sp. G11-F43 TaxID=3424130 RepID=UPI003D3560EA
MAAISEAKTGGRAGRHAGVQVGVAGDRGAERLGNGRTHRFRGLRPMRPGV